jgi:hypothetical protein
MLFTCCAGAPKITSPDDCLVVIKSEFVNPPELSYSQQNSRYFQFRLSGNYPPATIKKEYTMVVVKEPAVKVVSISSGADGGFVGKSFEYKLNGVLPYKPGYLIVANFVFVRTVEKVGLNTIFTKFSFRNITKAEREELLGRFQNDSAFAEWKK